MRQKIGHEMMKSNFHNFPPTCPLHVVCRLKRLINFGLKYFKIKCTVLCGSVGLRHSNMKQQTFPRSLHWMTDCGVYISIHVLFTVWFFFFFWSLYRVNAKINGCHPYTDTNIVRTPPTATTYIFHTKKKKTKIEWIIMDRLRGICFYFREKSRHRIQT